MSIIGSLTSFRHRVTWEAPGVLGVDMSSSTTSPIDAETLANIVEKTASFALAIGLLV